MKVEFLPWITLADAPDEPGLYAWYYNPRISTTVVDNLITAVETEDGSGTEAAKIRVRAFLEEQIFTRLKAPAYSAFLSGQLRPTYEGQLEMVSAVSESLVQRLAADPKRLHGIATALAGMAPHFASPLYIGMARRLRSRLAQHKIRILEIAQSQAELGSRSLNDSSQTADTSFALEVARRGIPYTALWVAVSQLSGLGDPVDVENVLNRLNHPLFGKN